MAQKTCQDSIELARAYERAGITKVFATPHFMPGTAWSADKETVLQLIDKLQAVLDAEQINLQIVPGMEIGLSHEDGGALAFWSGFIAWR